ncbi:M1 family peptidase, partial [candidate division KSB1 bacterium]|nr:M1 family peptidase [candidate division KSB1 bacterium]
REPIIGPTGVNHWPTGDQYFKGALFLHTLRNVVDDDAKWWAMLRDYAEHFKYKNIYTTDVINFFNSYFKRDFSPLFEQYLYHASLPKLQVKFGEHEVSYRWQAEAEDFNMPVKIRNNPPDARSFRTVAPTSQWQTEKRAGVTKEHWQVATDLFYVEVEDVSAKKIEE